MSVMQIYQKGDLIEVFQYLKSPIRKMGSDILAGPVEIQQGIMVLY